MTRILSAIKFDMVFQFRHGFYYAYLVVCALYIIILRCIPAGFREFVATLVILSDPAVVGFFFIGGIILLEKGQNTLEGLFVTPLRLYEYMLSKILSLSILGVLTSFAIAFFTFGAAFNPLPLLTGVLLSSAVFTLMGVVVAVRVNTVNEYMILASAYITILFLPVFGFLGIFRTPLFFILPAQPALTLLSQVFGKTNPAGWLYAIPALLLWIAVSYKWAYKWFYKYIILKTGGDSK